MCETRDINNIEDLKQCVNSYVIEDDDISIYFLLKIIIDDNVHYELEKLNLVNDNLIEVKNYFIENLRILINDEELQLMNLSQIDERTNVIAKFDYEGNNYFLDFMNTLFINNDIEDIVNGYEQSRVIGLFAKLGNSDNPIILFNNMPPISILKNRRLFKKNNEGLFELNKGDQYSISGKFDCLYINNNLYINNLKSFEKLDGFEEIRNNEANNRVSLISDLEILQDDTYLYDNIDKNIAKLIKLNPSSPVFSKTREEIINFIGTKDKYKNLFKIEDGKINITSQKDIKNLVSLLNDSFLTSELTNTDYNAKAKDKF